MNLERYVGAILCMALVWMGGSFGCVGSEPKAPGATLSVTAAALGLLDVGDVVWDIEVVNGQAPTPAVVWRQRVTASRFGDGRGAVSYVGPCDASAGANQNTVRLWVVGVYDDPVSSVGVFASGASGGVVGAALPFENPTRDGPLTRTVRCDPNADTPVRFDVTVMRPAQQGFFDIAVSFNDIFCSAKFDCCVENAAGTACVSDLTLLHDGDGDRSTTFVLGFACTAGPRTDVETELYLDALELDCTSPSGGFGADFVIDPSGPEGNQCDPNDVGACAALGTPTSMDADDYIYQVGVYRGLELLQSGGAPAQKAYWNIGLGVVRKGSGPGAVGIEDCRLRTRGTADDALGTGFVDDGVIAAGVVYPYIAWNVDLGACRTEPLGFGETTAMVRTDYTRTDASDATRFGFGFGPNLPAGPFDAVAPEGFRFIEAGTFKMGSPEGELGRTSGGSTGEVQHDVTLTRDIFLQATEVTQGEWKALSGGVNPSGFSSCGDQCPVERLDWYSALAYANELSLSQGLQACYSLTGCDDQGQGWKDGQHSGCSAASFAGLDCTGYRLPTEAEWEYAARAGTTTATPEGNLVVLDWGCSVLQPALDSLAWWCRNSGDVGGSANRRTQTVATKAPNGWGLYDMLGNVSEWTWDRLGTYLGASTDPTGPGAGNSRTFRGGSWNSVAPSLRAAARNADLPTTTSSDRGFRLCRTVSP